MSKNMSKNAVAFDQFLECQLEYYQEYETKRDEFLAAKEDLIKATSGLICHPEISRGFKRYLLKFVKTL